MVLRFCSLQKQNAGRYSGAVEDAALQRNHSLQQIRIYKLLPHLSILTSSEQNALWKNDCDTTMSGIH